jgi:RNA polymerase sigma-70 factor (ECF subfamily)
VRLKRPALPPGADTEIRGATTVADATVMFGRNSRFAESALVNGEVGVVVAPRGRLMLVLTFTIQGHRIARYEVIADPKRLAGLDLAVLGE